MSSLPPEVVQGAPDASVDPSMMAFVRKTREDFMRMQMEHQFGVDEILTKVSILQREFMHLHQYNPIEHVSSRIKSTSSILEKALRRDLELTPAAIQAGITDIAGIRITCSFISDTYRVLETLTSQSDVVVLQIKDYIESPKANGYQSLHAIIQIPVFLTSGPMPVTVEVQIRTIAMDFWASLDHKIHYKYNGVVPGHLTASLTETAAIAGQLDRRMEQLHQEVRGIDPQGDSEASPAIEGVDEQLLLRLWQRAQPAKR